jgi:predicted  nucleic acid-binding Zn-ribbon protein
VENTRSSEEADLVRCLECGTVYSQPASNIEAGACPNCGYVGWIALNVGQKPSERKS